MRPGHTIQTFERRIGAPIVDEADVPVDAHRLERARQLGKEAFDDRRFVVAGHDDRELGP